MIKLISFEFKIEGFNLEPTYVITVSTSESNLVMSYAVLYLEMDFANWRLKIDQTYSQLLSGEL